MDRRPRSLLSFLQLPGTSTCRAPLIQSLRNAEIGACNMERERPPYLPEIKAERWSAPWLTLIGVTVLALAIFGIRQHFATQDVWNQRFIRQPAASVAEMRAEADCGCAVGLPNDTSCRRSASSRNRLLSTRNRSRGQSPRSRRSIYLFISAYNSSTTFSRISPASSKLVLVNTDIPMFFLG